MLNKLKKIGKWGAIFYIGYNAIAGLVLLIVGPELITTLTEMAGL